jgi:hypothetical protein
LLAYESKRNIFRLAYLASIEHDNKKMMQKFGWREKRNILESEHEKKKASLNEQFRVLTSSSFLQDSRGEHGSSEFLLYAVSLQSVVQ